MKGIDEFVSVLTSLKKEDEVKRFLEEVLTKKEQKDIALRWELMKRLKIGHVQRKVASDLHLSLCKITRGSKILQEKDSMSDKLLDKLLKKQNVKPKKFQKENGKK